MFVFSLVTLSGATTIHKVTSINLSMRHLMLFVIKIRSNISINKVNRRRTSDNWFDICEFSVLFSILQFGERLFIVTCCVKHAKLLSEWKWFDICEFSVLFSILQFGEQLFTVICCVKHAKLLSEWKWFDICEFSVLFSILQFGEQLFTVICCVKQAKLLSEWRWLG